MITIYDHTGETPIEYEHSIFGRCHGVLFVRRGKDDSHVCIQPITEDDGNWFVTSNSFSSYWLPDYISLMEEARDWLERHCEQYSDGYGWRFRE